MDPVLLGWQDDAAPAIVVTPMDPVLLGWDGGAASNAPVWIDSAVAMGDGLILS